MDSLSKREGFAARTVEEYEAFLQEQSQSFHAIIRLRDANILGLKPRKWWGVTYHDILRMETHYHPIPFNYVVRFCWAAQAAFRAFRSVMRD